jgi:hypothetical protein
MATAYKVLGRAAPSSTSAVDVYTVLAGKYHIISLINVTALDTSRPTLTIDVRPNGTAAANDTKIVKDATITPGKAHSFGRGITLDPSDVLTVTASAGDKVSVMVFGAEIDI